MDALVFTLIVMFYCACRFVSPGHSWSFQKNIAAHYKQCLIHYSVLYNELDDANMENYNRTLNYLLTTWPRSLSMPCQKASLCPAETQEYKHQHTTKEVTVGTESFAKLDLYQSSSKSLTPLTIYTLRATTPLLVP